MANEEQVKILKQGVDIWNKWRIENPSAKIDFYRTDLSGDDLSGANLGRVYFCESILTSTNLSKAFLAGSELIGSDLSNAILTESKLTGTNLANADFTGANLREADLAYTNLTRTNFTRANLSGANLFRADLEVSNLSSADLSNADLRKVNFTKADLTSANLTGANLFEANLSYAHFYGSNLFGANLVNANLELTNLTYAHLNRANLSFASLNSTIFSEVDLSETYGLEEIDHKFPSALGASTIKLSKGKIPEVFLRGCGLSDWEIESAKLYKPDLSNEEINSIIYKIFDIRAQQSIQISPLFISYSHADTFLVEKLESHLTKLGVRFWRDVHDATAGRLETQIDRAMRQNPTVLLILSKNSTASDWVEHEARLARELEKEIGRDILCPIALDDSWKSAKWPARLMEQIMEYNILDFSKWQDDASFEKTFSKMINGLDMFYKPESTK